MTRPSIALAPTGLAAGRISAGILDRHLERLTGFLDEWRTRRTIKRSLGRLSDFHLYDIGLTKADVEAAVADGLDRSASFALKRAIQSRMENW